MAQSRGASIADVLGLTESKEASGYGVADGIVGKEGASLPARWALEERDTRGRHFWLRAQHGRSPKTDTQGMVPRPTYRVGSLL